MMDITINDVRSLEPPAIYDYEPTKDYVVHNVNSRRFKQYCGTDPEGFLTLGCTINGHIIYIRNDLPKEVYDVILRHEKAHVNGWVHRNVKLDEQLRNLRK
jgi:hypothetical protein